MTPMQSSGMFILEKVIFPGTLAILVALLTVRFAFRRFKNEAMWSKKFDAYSTILNSLHLARIQAEKNYEEEARFGQMEGPPSYSVEYRKHLEEVNKAAIKADADVKRILDVGALLISKEARAFLEEALKPRADDWRNEPGVVFWNTEEKNMRAAIDRVTEIARRDLGV